MGAGGRQRGVAEQLEYAPGHVAVQQSGVPDLAVRHSRGQSGPAVMAGRSMG